MDDIASRNDSHSIMEWKIGAKKVDCSIRKTWMISQLYSVHVDAIFQKSVYEYVITRLICETI